MIGDKSDDITFTVMPEMFVAILVALEDSGKMRPSAQFKLLVLREHLLQQAGICLTCGFKVQHCAGHENTPIRLMPKPK